MIIGKALSIKQPWLWLILNKLKDIEIRTWNTKYRGIVALHASKTVDSQGYYYLKEKGIQMPLKNLLETGKVLGYATLTGVINFKDNFQFTTFKERHLNSSRWFDGRQKGFIFEDIRKIPPIEMNGSLNLFNVNIRVE